MRAKLEESVSMTEHKKVNSQKETLEKLCRALQSEIQQLRPSKQTPDNADTNDVQPLS